MAVANVPDQDSPSEQSGGYDNDFISKVPERLICDTVCTKVLSEPHITSCCGQHVCESCLNYWFHKHRKESCPHCRAEGSEFNYFLDKKLKREILELEIRCTNKGKGCVWTGELHNLEKHIQSENGCGFVEVECSNDKCRKIILRKDLQEHLEKYCEYRQVTCKYCNKKGMYCIMSGWLHQDMCKNYPLACPNKCGEDKIQRQDMTAHREKCPLEPVKCPFAQAGCKIGLVRKQLDQHLTDNQQKHLLQLMVDHQETKRSLQVATGRLESMQEGISSDIAQLAKIKDTKESEDVLRSIQSQLGSPELNKIEDYGIENGFTIRVPSVVYFKDKTDWYSPTFYVHGLKVCVRAQYKEPQEHFQWWLVLLGPNNRQGNCCDALVGTQPISCSDIYFHLPCLALDTQINDSIIGNSYGHGVKPMTDPLILTLYISKELISMCPNCDT